MDVVLAGNGTPGGNITRRAGIGGANETRRGDTGGTKVTEAGEGAVHHVLVDPELDAFEFQDGPLEGGREPGGKTAMASPSVGSPTDSGRNNSSSEGYAACGVGVAPATKALAVSDDLLLG